MMFDELTHMLPDEPNDPLALLMIAGLVRDDLPWLSEVMLEVYREVRAGDEKAARRAIQRLHRVTRAMRRGPFMEEFLMESRESHMMLMELPHFIERFLQRYEPPRDRELEVTEEQLSNPAD